MDFEATIVHRDRGSDLVMEIREVILSHQDAEVLECRDQPVREPAL